MIFFFPDAFGGTSIDWTTGSAGVPLSYAMELRNLYNFIIPDEDIQGAVSTINIFKEIDNSK